MLPSRQTLLRLMRSNTSFFIYGQKASGKTCLVKELFKESGMAFIEINCMLISKKAHFLQLFNVELNKYLVSREINQFERLKASSNLESWIRDINELIYEREDIVDKLDGLYVFMDNMEELQLSDWFMPAFYSACQREFSFRMSFLFCGINFMRKEYTLELPFRTMLTFCMPKPVEQSQKIISEVLEELFRVAFGGKSKQEDIDKTVTALTKQITAGFDNIEFNLWKIREMTKAVFELCKDLLNESDLSKSLLRIINTQKLKEIFQKVIECGPLDEHEVERLKDTNEGEEQYEVNASLEYYPNLILASIHLADYYPEKEDKRRFQDYKGRTNMRNKDLKKSEFKVGRHNINRIVAISEALESQAKLNDKEQKLQHHSLDYYATFEHLRKMNRLRIFGSKCTGMIKEEEARAFIAKCELKYEQFMQNN